MTQIQLENGLYITDSTAEASAIVQADSTSQGFLPPRMTSAQRDAISSPATGLMIFNTDDNAYNLYEGTAWVAVGRNGIGDHGCHVYHDASQSIAHYNTSPLSFNQEHKDTDGYHDTSVNNSRLTIPNGQAGTYFLTGNVRWASSSSGSFRSLYIRRNGPSGDKIAYQEMSPVASSIMQVATVYDLAEGDYVELVPVQDTLSSLNIVVSNHYSPEFRIQRIA
ncbi:MAG: hypothetical protein Crog4KO_35030 [Crocinitomicaceae bacterium]